jgi:hypothetical protein
MAKTPVRFLDWSGQLNTGVNEFAMADNELTEMKNCYGDKIGRLKKCPGYSLSNNSQVVNDKSVNFLHNYTQSSTGAAYLIGGSDSGSDYILESRTTGAWAAISGATYSGRAGSELSAINYLNKVFIVGHDSGTFLSPASLNGTDYTVSAVTDKDLTAMAGGKYITSYRDLLYVGNAYLDAKAYPSRVYFSKTPVNLELPAWSATDFIEVGYKDGDNITGLADALDRLVIFKNWSMWKYDESNLTKIDDVGCSSYRSIAKINQTLYWFNRDGFWRWTGAQPELISARAQDFIDAIPQTSIGNVVGGVYNSFEYRAYIGTVTVNGTIYTNAWFCFNTRTEKCYIRCTYDPAYSVSEYIETDTGMKRLYFGNGDGYVMKFATEIDKTYSDNGNPIDSFFTTKYLDYGYPEQNKFASHITFFTDCNNGMRVFIGVDGTEKLFNNDESQALLETIDERDIVATGKRFKFKFAENGTTQSWIFNGMICEVDLIG